MKHQDRSQFFKAVALWIFGIVSAGTIFAALDIPTNIDNAVQTIKQIQLTTDGQASANPTLILNGNPAAGQATVQISGSLVAGAYTGSNANSIWSQFSTIVAGLMNKIFSNGNNSVIVGGNSNKIYSENSIILGGESNVASGIYSTAGGYKAQALNPYTWVWSDKSPTYDDDPIPSIFTSTNSNQFLIRALNGVGINTNTPIVGGLSVNGKVGSIQYCDLSGSNCRYPAEILTGTASSFTSGYVVKWNGAKLTSGTIYDNGNIGIGTNNPGTKLDVVGNAYFGDSTQDSQVIKVRGITYAQATFQNNANFYNMGIRAGGGFTFTNGANNANVFSLGSDATAGRIAVLSNNVSFNAANGGNVGIGWSNGYTIPSRFTVVGNGSTSASSALDVQNSANTSMLFVRDDGKVGIGTTTPGSKLQVQDATAGNGDILKLVKNIGLGQYQDIRFETPAGTDTSFIRHFIGPGSDPNAIQIGFGQSTGLVMFSVFTNGNVGIGTLTPTEKLEVAGNIKSPGFYAKGTGVTVGSTSGVALGNYNQGLSNSVLEVGVGTGISARKNALTVYDNGAVNVDGDNGLSCLYTVQKFVAPSYWPSNTTTYQGWSRVAGEQIYPYNWQNNWDNSPKMSYNGETFPLVDYLPNSTMRSNLVNGYASPMQSGPCQNYTGTFRLGYYDWSYGNWDANIGMYRMFYYNGYTASAVYYKITAVQIPARSSSLSISKYGDVGIGMSTTGYTATGAYKLEVQGRFKASGIVANGYGATGNLQGANAMGSFASANGSNSTAIGSLSTANANYSNAIGYRTTAFRDAATAIGYNAYANGNYSTMIGVANGADSNYGAVGDYSVALGYYPRALGQMSIAIGNGAYVSPNTEGAISIGNGTMNNSNYSTSLGAFNMGYSDSSFELGGAAWSDWNGGYTNFNTMTVHKNGGIVMNTHGGNLYTYGQDEWRSDWQPNAYPCGPDTWCTTDSYGVAITFTPTNFDGWCYYMDRFNYGGSEAVYDTNMQNIWWNTNTSAMNLPSGWYLDGQAQSCNNGDGTYNFWYNMPHVINYGSTLSTDPYAISNPSFSISPVGDVAVGADISNNTSIGDKLSVYGTFKSAGLHAKGESVSAGGQYATAMGYNTTANGMYSAAIGSYNQANGERSVAIGTHALASNYASTAMGDDTIAGGQYATAMGFRSRANGDRSTAMGYNTTANGYSSTAMGNHTTANGQNSTAIGDHTTAQGENSVSMGAGTVAKGNRSVTMGTKTTATAKDAVAMGYETTGAAIASVAMGYRTIANAPDALVIGRYNVGLPNSLFEVGYGTDALRKNAFAVLDNGTVQIDKLDVTTSVSTPLLLVDKVINRTTANISFSGAFLPDTGANIQYQTIGNATTPWNQIYARELYLDGMIVKGSDVRAEAEKTTAMGFRSRALGQNSTAMGYNTTAQGKYSTAMGNHTTAIGENSTAIGDHTTAQGENSVSMGAGTVAQGNRSVTMGTLTTATAKDAVAMGYGTRAQGIASVAMGYNTIAQGIDSVAMGELSQANGAASLAAGRSFATADYTVAMGNSTSTQKYATAFGYSYAYGFASVAMGTSYARTAYSVALGNADAQGVASVAIGSGSRSTATGSVSIGNAFATAPSAVAIGDWSIAQGTNSTALGASTAKGQYSVAMGKSVSEGTYSTAMGIASTSADYAVAMGDSQAKAQYSVAMGKGTSTSTSAEATTVIGKYNAPVSNSLFEVGMGTFGSPSNAMTVLNNGNVGIGTGAASFKLDVVGTGKFSAGVRAAQYCDANGLNCFSANTVSNVTVSANIVPKSNGTSLINGSMYDIGGKVGIGTSSVVEALTVSGNVLAGGFFYSSDITLKKDIVSLDRALEKINQLNGYSFSWKATDRKDIGVIAQEVEKVYPELVHTDDNGIKSVEYANLVAPIIEAIKSLTHKIDILFNKYLDQESRIDALEMRLQQLEAHK